ncbi:MAG TPA: hypothetical protein VG297_24720 [Bryobacteraceae bacterium]|nr:hypothetical protein [Bryobacteraceae bacterium]
MMRILFDHGAPRGLMSLLVGHSVVAASDKGWDRLKNGALLKAAEEDGFELLLTTDRRIQYQQNLKDQTLAIVVLTGTTKWSQVRLHCEAIAAAVNAAQKGLTPEVEIPFPSK